MTLYTNIYKDSYGVDSIDTFDNLDEACANLHEHRNRYFTTITHDNGKVDFIDLYESGDLDNWLKDNESETVKANSQSAKADDVWKDL